MSWQDVVMAVGQFVFFVALIPTIKAKEKPALSTCVVTAVILTAYIPTLWTLGLYISMSSTVLIAGGWWTLSIQSYRR
jgi:hypothetical protein